MTKKLIINADDYGLDDDANLAIIQLARYHAITSTSVMANMVTDEAIGLLKQMPISTGLHLNLIEGKPVSDPELVRSLTDRDGNFLSCRKLLTGFVLGSVRKEEIELEITNQLESLKYKGLTISHADSHKHIHQYPVLGPFILNVFNRLGIKRIRNCSPSDNTHQRMQVLDWFSRITRHGLSSFETPQRLVTHFSANNSNLFYNFPNVILDLFNRYDTLEVMTHPGIRDRQGSYLHRQSEFEYLKENMFSLQKYQLKNVKLISYADL